MFECFTLIRTSNAININFLIALMANLLNCMQTFVWNSLIGSSSADNYCIVQLVNPAPPPPPSPHIFEKMVVAVLVPVSIKCSVAYAF